MYDTPDVRAHGIDSRVRAEAKVVHLQVGGSLVDNVTNHVHFHQIASRHFSEREPLWDDKNMVLFFANPDSNV